MKKLLSVIELLAYPAIIFLVLHIGKLDIINRISIYEDAHPNSQLGYPLELRGGRAFLPRHDASKALDFVPASLIILLESAWNMNDEESKRKELAWKKILEKENAAQEEKDAALYEPPEIREPWDPFGSFLKNNIFRTKQLKAAEPKPEEKVPEEKPRPQRNAIVEDALKNIASKKFNWKLTGVIIAGKRKIALLQHSESGETKMVKLGEEALDGYRIILVERNFIIMKTPIEIIKVDKARRGEDSIITVLKQFEDRFSVDGESEGAAETQFEPELPAPPPMDEQGRQARPIKEPPERFSGANDAAAEAAGPDMEEAPGDSEAGPAESDEPEEEPAPEEPACTWPNGMILGSLKGDDGQSRLKITHIVEGSLAEKLGLQKDDILKGVNDKPSNTIAEFRQAFAECVKGEKVQLLLERNGLPLVKSY